MTDKPPGARETALRTVERALQAAPDAIEPRFRRAGVLAALGRAEEAKQDYLAVLAREPSHWGALNDFATLLHAEGYRSAARTLYREAAARHAEHPVAHVNLANLLLEDGAFDEARRHYATALALAPDLAEAHQGLAHALDELGEAHDEAERHRALGFRARPVAALPFRGPGEGVALLQLVSARGGDVPTRGLIDEAVFRRWAVVPEFCPPELDLPPHRLVVNAIGDADRAGPALDAASTLLARTAAPVINPPDRVRATARLANARRLGDLPGVIAPRMAMVSRAALARADAAALLAREGLGFPLLLRSPGFHTGRHFERVESAAELPHALAALPGEALAAIEFLVATGADGLARKYRVMMIDGALYPLHLAVAPHWKVHYFTAAMAHEPAHRAEEAAFLADMTRALGDGAVAALERIRDTIGLDYAGVDFGLTKRGEVLLFEANATMVVNPPEPDAIWDYRRAPVARILDACRTMLLRRADDGRERSGA
jgi:glutathione synthase/RimK-type ligase-like ATP-grasp enzyme